MGVWAWVSVVSLVLGVVLGWDVVFGYPRRGCIYGSSWSF